MILKKKITPCLLFSADAHKAAKFYTSIFKKSKITHSNHLATSFQIEGHDFVALNGPDSEFTWAVSFYVACKNQKEIDYYWSKLLAGGGKEQPCGWIQDKYGLSWQIAPPNAVMKLFEDKDKKKAQRAMDAMMGMKKIDIATIRKAHAGKMI